MKLKELLDEKGLSDSISKNLEEALFSKINNFIIDLIIKQNNIDISSFIQRLALLLNSDYQKEIVSTINFISGVSKKLDILFLWKKKRKERVKIVVK